jgi:preprotein translocase subunit SecF
MLRILHNTSWNFLKQWKLAVISVIVFVLPAIVLVPLKGFRYSIEFTGGTQVQLTFKQAPSIEDVRAVLSASGHGDAEVITFGAPNEIKIRAQEAQQVEQLVEGASMRTPSRSVRHRASARASATNSAVRPRSR